MTDPRHVLATLAADPERLDHVPAGDLPELIGEAEALRARLLARLVAASAASAPPERVGAPQRNGAAPGASGAPDRLLTVAEACDILGVSRQWLYNHRDELPFARKLARGGALRFSSRGLERWAEGRR